MTRCWFFRTDAMEQLKFTEFKLTRNMCLTYPAWKFAYKLVPRENEKVPPSPIPFFVQLKAPQGDLAKSYTPFKFSNDTMEFILNVDDVDRMTQFLVNQKLGDVILISDPIPRFCYVPNQWRKIGMICSGTGIASFWHLIQAILTNSDDKTEVTMLYECGSEDSIIFKAEIETLMHNHPSFNCYFILNHPGKSPTGFTGTIDVELISKYLHSSNEPQSLLLVCGPERLINDLVGPKEPDGSQGPLEGTLKTLGFCERNVHIF
eukprot:Gregarina_sp_Poly_1__10700@NODE_80_length_15637_cov_125_963134_g68_i0_p8_GENE_NODE_80_length_15637_cov_125_963134_g68_i0NODE_80_length_15637_cov_125_963134_g68_i0_p8_ORF_typecomplete_len262_score19_45NAD_binding_1/PF00175_21/3_9e20FAD_binding_6/PF00970_24/4_2e05FAD_binding_6/PF00970_24/7_9e03TMEM237/PF15383_6/0_076NAD_binding_6/PF08030_12/0_48_NODE_80_length_15637_cov_125_963134_g68_i023153100